MEIKKRKIISEETKRKISNTKKGKHPWNFGLTSEDPRVMKYVSKIKGIKKPGAGKNLIEYKKIHGIWNKGLKGEEYTKHFKNGAQSFARYQLKGKTFEEIYGPEKAKEQKSKRTETIKEYYDNGTATFGFPKDGTMKLKRAEQIFPIKDTSIELKIQDFLKELQVGFFTHYYCKEINNAYQCDIFIPVQKSKTFFIKQPIIIEADGDYWHGNINHFRNKILTDKQKEQIKIDFLRTQQLTEKGFKVVRLWESDIKNLDLTIFKNKIGILI